MRKNESPQASNVELTTVIMREFNKINKCDAPFATELYQLSKSLAVIMEISIAQTNATVSWLFEKFSGFICNYKATN